MESKYVLVYLVVVAYCMANLIIVYSKTKSYLGDYEQITLFKRMALMFGAFLILEFIWMLGYGKILPIPLAVASFCKILSTMCIPLKVYFWFHFACSRLGVTKFASNKAKYISFIPYFVMCLCYLLTIMNGMVFSIAEDGSLIEGPMVALTGIIDNIYGIAIIVVAISVLYRSNDSIIRRRSVIHIIYILICTAGGVMDGILHMTPIMPLMITLCFSGLFSNFQETQITVDYATGMPNRTSAARFIDEALLNASEKTPVWLLMIDVQKNRSIRDKQRHITEENTIKYIANIIDEMTADNNAFAARWDRDKFVIVMDEAEDKVFHDFKKNLMQKINWDYREDHGIDFIIKSSEAKCIKPDTRTTSIINSSGRYRRAGRA